MSSTPRPPPQSSPPATDRSRATARRGQRSVAPKRAQLTLLVSVSMGGAVGTGARDAIATWVHVSTGTFPWATFWTNVTGSFVLGVGLIMILERFPPGRFVRPFFATGVCGGFTTWSTFMVESDLLVHGRHALMALTYLAATLVCGLAAAAIGVVWGRALPLELAPLFRHRVRPRRRFRG